MVLHDAKRYSDTKREMVRYMRLIQTFYTNKGSNFRMGFETAEDMKEFLVDSFKIHSANYEVVIYADSCGSEYLRTFLPAENIIETEYRLPNRKFWNHAKIITQSLQTEAYIHCDIDAVIYDKIEFEGVLTERYRSGMPMIEYQYCGLQPVARMVCSGILGFTDMELKNQYCIKFAELVENWKAAFVTYESLWTIEELMLTNMIGNTAVEMPIGSYKHLQGVRK